MILSHSRAKYVEFTKHCDLKSLERCILNAFEYFGGVPDVVLTDNMKTVVLRHETGKTIFLPAFESFCADMGFLPKTCQVRRPQTKGKVERLVRFLKMDSSASMAHLYGINWRYSGRDAQVRLYHGHVQIYVDNVPVADVPLTDVKEYYVPQGQQYNGLAAKNGVAWNPAVAIRTEEDVTERPLKTYDRLMEVVANA